MKTTDTHVYFWDGIYSNWHPAPFAYGGFTFANSEQAFMFKKAMEFKDSLSIGKILGQPNPREAKKIGRLVKGYNEQRWNEVRYNIMVDICYEKFKQNKPMLDELLATGDKILVEASPYDKVWGVGLSEDDPLILDEKNWKGSNLLGKALMEVREQLRRK